jgi:hypothetical protein
VAAQQAAAQAAQRAIARQAAARNGAAQPAAAFNAPNPQTDRWEPAAQQVNTGAYPAYRPAPEPEYAVAEYAAGSELDYSSGGAQGYGAPAPASAGYAPPAGAHAAAPAGSAGYDYLDNSHTADSGQFSQYIADQYNTGQVAAVDRGAPAAIQPRPHQGGRWSYA